MDSGPQPAELRGSFWQLAVISWAACETQNKITKAYIMFYVLLIFLFFMLFFLLNIRQLIPSRGFRVPKIMFVQFDTFLI